MFLLSARKSVLDVVKNLFKLKNISFFEVELLGNKYVLCYLEPWKILPFELVKKIKVQKISAADIKKLIQTEKRERDEKIEIKPGTKVLIVEGPYHGMRGVVSKLCNDDKVEVLIPVFGSYIPVKIQKQSIIPETL